MRVKLKKNSGFEYIFDDQKVLSPFDLFSSPVRVRRPSLFPRVDILETDGSLVVIADVPGVDPKTLYVYVNETHMQIVGEKVDDPRTTKDDERPHKYERMQGGFRRIIHLPTQVKEDKMQITHKEGVLTLILPKAHKERMIVG